MPRNRPDKRVDGAECLVRGGSPDEALRLRRARQARQRGLDDMRLLRTIFPRRPKSLRSNVEQALP